jgi:hypothetical protein
MDLDGSGSGEEFHPSALTEPDVRLSPHPAPVFQPLHTVEFNLIDSPIQLPAKMRPAED